MAQNVRGAADIDLVRRFQEVTDLLYLKQTQLEKMASEKAAQQLSLEREVRVAPLHVRIVVRVSSQPHAHGQNRRVCRCLPSVMSWTKQGGGRLLFGTPWKCTAPK